MRQFYFRLRTTIARNDFTDWEWKNSFLIGVWWLFFNHIANLDVKFDASLVIYKPVPDIFVVRIVELLVVDQLVDARLKHEALKVSQNEFEILLTNAFKRLCQVSPNLVVLRRAGV